MEGAQTPLTRCYSFFSDNVVGSLVGVAWNYLIPYVPEDDPLSFTIVLANDVIASATVGYVVYRINER